MTLKCLTFIFTAIIIICISFLLTKAVLKSLNYNNIPGVFSYIAIVLLIISLAGLFTCIDIDKQTKFQTALTEDWPFYLNGIEVDPENIYYEGYHIKYDKEAKKVLLYPRARRWY